MFDLIYPHIWWVAALSCSLATAAIFLTGQYSKLDGNLTVFWRGVIPFLFTTPFLFFFELPTSPYFYIITIVTAFIASYTDVRYMNGAVRYGAGAKLRVRPYTLWVVFIGWFLLSARYREEFLSHPMEAMGVTIGLIIVVIATSYMSRCEISRSAFMFFLPALFGSAALDILNKMAMDLSPILGGIFVYVWLQAGIVACVCFMKQCLSKEKAVAMFFDKKTLIIGGAIGCLFFVGNLSKNTAMTYTDNPAYVSAIILASPIWASLFYRLKGEKDEANEFAGLIVVASSIMLVIFASNI